MSRTSIKSILSRFYARQGLAGKHFRSAMRHDMRSLRQQGVNTNQGFAARLGGGLVSCGAIWDDLAEGGSYWATRDMFGRPPQRK